MGSEAIAKKSLMRYNTLTVKENAKFFLVKGTTYENAEYENA